jgi:hypothetical protein
MDFQTLLAGVSGSAVPELRLAVGDLPTFSDMSSQM